MKPSQPHPETIIDIKNVTYTHWNQTQPTLHDVSLQITSGTLNVLVGPSGSGKSTLCDLFNGVIPHLHGGKLEGEVWVAGVKTTEAEVKNLARHVGRVFQDPETMFAMLQVDDEIAFGPENMQMEVESIQAIVNDLLQQTDLAGRRQNLVWNLSGGQIQKLGLATVLAVRPQMIVLDEPTSNLDPGATHSVHQLVLALRDEGVTVLLVTRELDEFLAEADQLLILDAGRILAGGPPRDVLREHGQYMVDSLGVWLPETSEIGIRLLSDGGHEERAIPITVDESLHYLNQRGLLGQSYEAHETALEEVQPAKTEVLISAKNLHYTYPGGVEALKDISLDIHAGEWLMIVGRNGAGKSTLARLLVGLSKAVDGALILFGKDSRAWKVQDLANHLALVFQNPEHQFLTDTVADEIGYSLLAQGVNDPTEKERRTLALLQQLGLEEFRETHPFSLSAGLKRRLGVATMLGGNPDVLLVDEPTYGQDKEMTHTLMALMQKVRAEGVAVVMITHDMRLVQEYAERVVVMSGGRILFDGPSTGLFEQEDVLVQANLRRTILHDLMSGLAQQGVCLQSRVRCTADLVKILKSENKAEQVHG